MKNKFVLASLFISSLMVNAQENTQKTDTLQEVIISSSRIDLPFSKNSRTIQLITAEDLKKAGVTNGSTVTDIVWVNAQGNKIGSGVKV